MFSFQNISIKNKITLIIVGVTFLVITIGQSILFFKEIKDQKTNITNNYISYTNLIAENCISPLTFEDKNGVYQILLSANSTKDIHSIFVFDERKSVFSSFFNDEITSPPILRTHLHHFESNGYLIINQPVSYKDKVIGYIHVKVSLKSYHQFIYDKITFLSISTLSLLVLAYILASTLQRFISKPILDLANATTNFSNLENYFKNLNTARTDEIGVLYNSFNNLLTSLSLKEKERTAAEIALRESEEKFRVSFENAPLGIALLDLNGAFLQINTEICNLFHYSRAAFLKKNIRDIIHPSDIIESKNILDSLLSGKNIGKTIEVRFITKDNENIWCILNSNLVTLLDDSYIIIHLIDVTKRKEAEQAHLQLQNQVQQAHKMETIGTLAGGISHDFKNILNPIIGFSTLALQSLPNKSNAKKDIEKVIKAAHRADELVNQILAFSRQNEQIYSSISFSSVIKESIDLLRATIPSTTEIKVTNDISNEKVLGNHTQLQQVVMNLCTNAYHALPDGHGLITIHSTKVNIDQPFVDQHNELKIGEYLLLSVTDNGKGMSKDIISRIFDPFYTTKKVGQGTGLGLSVVHGVVKSHKGHIIVNSKTNEGTTFNVYLPISNEEDKSTHIKNEEVPEYFDGTVMIIDDDEMSLILMERILTNMGFDSIINSDSTIALQMIKNTPEIYDLIVCDQTMPKLTGVQLASTLKEDGIKIPFILNTGSSDYIDMDLRDKGVNVSIGKPITVTKLKSIISQLLPHSTTKSRS